MHKPLYRSIQNIHRPIHHLSIIIVNHRMNAKQFFSIDSTKGIAKLLIPGSKFYLLRPNGFGKSTLIKKLSKFIQGGEERKKIIHENTWLF